MGNCCCCCCKKKKPEPEKKQVDNAVVEIPKVIEKSTDIAALIRKYASFVMEWIVQENMQQIDKIIKEGFSPDIVFDAGGYDSTMLILTIAFKKDKLTRRALETKQNLNVVVMPNHDSALMMAISHRNVPIVQELLSKGANKNIQCNDNKTPIELARKQLDQCQSKEDTDGVNKMREIIQLLQ